MFLKHHCLFIDLKFLIVIIHLIVKFIIILLVRFTIYSFFFNMNSTNFLGCQLIIFVKNFLFFIYFNILEIIIFIVINFIIFDFLHKIIYYYFSLIKLEFIGINFI